MEFPFLSFCKSGYPASGSSPKKISGVRWPPLLVKRLMASSVVGSCDDSIGVILFIDAARTAADICVHNWLTLFQLTCTPSLRNRPWIVFLS